MYPYAKFGDPRSHSNGDMVGIRFFFEAGQNIIGHSDLHFICYTPPSVSIGVSIY